MRRWGSSFVAVCLVGVPGRAWAGMPAVDLTDVARFRLDTLSFFLVTLLALAGVVQLLWNYLQRNLTALPRLRYGRALALTVLAGLLFAFVLTMISGARELLTPGAWERAGVTYELTPIASPAEQLEAARRLRLEQLRAALWRWAEAHAGALPANDGGPELDDDVWTTLHPSRARFVYVGGTVGAERRGLVACEPSSYPYPRFALFEDGRVELTSRTALEAAMEAPR